MPKKLCIVFALLFATLDSPSLSQQKLVTVDYAFLIDVSGSMSGATGHFNIFPKVKSAIRDFVRQVDVGSTVFFFPFAGEIRESKSFEVVSDADRVRIENYVDGLIANGSHTAIYNSLESSLRSIEEHRKRHSGDRAVIFYVYTDGDDNVSIRWSLSSILSHFNLERGKHDWLFYTELGLKKDADKISEFRKYERTEYGNEDPGSVAHLIQVEVLLPFLNFGNMKQDLKSTRLQKFNIIGKEHLAPSYKMKIVPEFEELKKQGCYVQVRPLDFFPNENLELELSLVNSQTLRDGEYKGYLKLISGDPRVIIVPNQIEVSFLYEPQRAVEIQPKHGTEFPLSFGGFRTKEGGLVVETRSLIVSFNAPAESAGERLKVKLVPDLSNPYALDLKTELVVNEGGGGEVWVGPGSREIVLTLTASSKISAGEYKGILIFENSNLVIAGPSLSAVENIPGAKQLAWSFNVQSAPWPWWVWVIVFFALGGIAFAFIFHRMKPPVLPDLRLEIKHPEVKEIDLTGKHEVLFGEGGESLLDSVCSFVVFAKKEKNSVCAVLHVKEGEAFLTKAGESERVSIVGEEKVYDGDKIEIGNTKGIFSSFSLSRNES